MKLNGLNIYGIKHIVVTGKRSVKWTRTPIFNEKTKTGYIWIKNYNPSEFDSHEPASTRSDPDTINFIKYALANPDRYKVWFHTDTININPPNLE
ncbi:hypothetical protein [Bacteroides sp.]|uniref:hypothetical protein n=1 Tax=Bacteroides sp. TaxID=29523 RepID=UPI0026303788|nr:hypothetical protein [Bacteroides sp.]MDD3039081.1 hypothetical protein [Bacteroides sp.]